MDPSSTAVGLTAVTLAVTKEAPRILVVRRPCPDPQDGDGAKPGPAPGIDALPFGPFEPVRHRTLELGIRQWVEEQTGLDLRYVEQLYTFGNKYRDTREMLGGPRLVSVAYLALTVEAPVAGSGEARWRDWYGFLPWEDWRDGTPELVSAVIRPALKSWIRKTRGLAERRRREERVDICFGLDSGSGHDRIRTLERYELLYEAGLVPEAHRDSEARGMTGGDGFPAPDSKTRKLAERLGPAMAFDDRRILASALGRIRGKLAYRPVIFELLPDQFTLLQLQRVVEALAGARLHKQNFRRMLMAGDLLEATGGTDAGGPGRPAALYRFRREVVRERAAVGVGLPSIRAAE